MSAFQHIAMNCIDRLAQERFYTDVFGFRRARVFQADTPNEFVMLRLGSLCLEFFNAPDGQAAPSPGEQPVGFKHLAFDVPDIEATVAKLQSMGLDTGPVVDCSDQVPGLRVCFLKDPEGNILELMEGWHDDPALSAEG